MIYSIYLTVAQNRLIKEMSNAKAGSKVRLVKSENKWGRSNRRHFARQNHRKRTSGQYEKKFKNVQLSQFSADKWIPSPSGYTRGQGWNCLFRAWLGYKIANNPKNGESFQDRLGWAVTIQNIQTDFRPTTECVPRFRTKWRLCVCIYYIKTNGIRRSG